MLVFLTIFLTFFSLLSYVFKAVFSIMAYDWLFFKLFIILFLLYLIYFYYKRSTQNKFKLSFRREMKFKSYLKYKIHDENDLDIALCLVYLYFLFFIILIFTRRLANIDKILDLNIYYAKVLYVSKEISLVSLCLNMLLMLCLFIIYFLILSNAMKYFKKQMYKLYFYVFIYFHDQFYHKMLKMQNYLDINHYMTTFLNYLWEHVYNVDISKPLPISLRFISSHLSGLQYIFHRVLLLIVIIYDLVFNNMLLTHMFKLLPFVFIYELLVRISIFLRGANFDCDEIIVKLLYSVITQISIDTRCLYIDGMPYEKMILREVITKYAKDGFRDKNFLPQDPIKEGIDDIIFFWQNLIEKRLEKYAYLDKTIIGIVIGEIILYISIKILF